MDELSQLTVNYFRSSVTYFWHWADEGEVIQGSFGKTLIYREDLVYLLEGLVTDGFPRLSSLLMVLYGARFGRVMESWKEEQLAISLGASGQFQDIDLQQVEEVIKLMGVINSLPEALRTGTDRIHLIQDLLGSDPHKLSPQQSADILNLFKSGKLDEEVFFPGPRITSGRIKLDCETLQAEGKYLTVEMLENRLKTGLTKAPDPEEFPLPEPTPTDLLQEMLQDQRTESLARLTQRIVAALSIPLHSKGESDQSFGGVSDITNRGDFDRLLLSELAYDDTTLMARLANNEALYLRREEPTTHVERDRSLVVDLTLKMWGTPRVFALAAAVACARPTKQLTEIHAYGLLGKRAQSLDLKTKEGVLEAMEKLDPALDCGKALSLFMQDHPASANTEIILITGAAYAESAEFATRLTTLKRKPDYVLTVDRAGTLRFIQLRGGRKKLLRTARFDLKEILSPTDHKRVIQRGELPAIYEQPLFPLYFPTTEMRLKPGLVFALSNGGMVGITETQRVMVWNHKEYGAEEWLDHVEAGDYYFAERYDGMLYLLVHARKAGVIRLYSNGPGLKSSVTLDLSEEIKWPSRIFYYQEHFYLISHREDFGLIVDTDKMKIGRKLTTPKLLALLKKRGISLYSDMTPRPNFGELKQLINNGYSVLKRISRIGVTHDGLLCLDNRQLDLLEETTLRIRFRGGGDKVVCVGRKVKTGPLANHPQLEYLNFEFPNGSSILLDPKGMLHLRSADEKLTEVTILLVLGLPTACWAADGAVCGPEYFTGDSSGKRISVSVFYNQYLQPIIDQLI